MKNRILYWCCQIFGWGLYGSIGLAALKFGGQAISNWIPIFLGQIITIIFLTHKFRNYIIRKNLIQKSLKEILFRIIISIILISIIANLVTSFLMLYPFKIITWEQYSIKMLMFYIFNTSFFVIAWTGIYLTISYIRYTRKKEIEELQLKVIAKDSQLNALKAQINPHFIFNSLNNIRSLMFENTDQASDMITHLSDLLRYSMKFSDSGKETIRQELEVVNDYLNLQSIHLENRLKYNFDVDDNLLEYKIPSMSIQLLIENAIKHGIQDLPEGGLVSIKIYRLDNNIFIEISNTGKIKNNNSSTKIGLRNAEDRLNLMFGEKAQLILEQTDQNKVTAKFNIPISE